MSKKMRWVNMEITRIKLNPEQAVLSCCQSNTRNCHSPNGWEQCNGECGNGCWSCERTLSS